MLVDEDQFPLPLAENIRSLNLAQDAIGNFLIELPLRGEGGLADHPRGLFLIPTTGGRRGIGLKGHLKRDRIPLLFGNGLPAWKADFDRDPVSRPHERLCLISNFPSALGWTFTSIEGGHHKNDHWISFAGCAIGLHDRLVDHSILHIASIDIKIDSIRIPLGKRWKTREA
jgi:hypothetical protein